MPIKNLFYRFQPAPLYIVLILSICYFSVQLILSHLTHALTLLMASYHMLCNIFALAGSIITIKHNELHNEQKLFYSTPDLKNDPSLKGESKQIVTRMDKSGKTIKDEASTDGKNRELENRNTFGWARIEILTTLIVCITLASLSFSLLLEALQTLVHIDHQDSMHLPVHVMILGVVGLLLNGFTYFVIGGYTLNQGSFLHINPSDGKVVVEPSNITIDRDDKVLSASQDSNNDRHLKEDLSAELGKVHYRTRREGPAELLRDVSSTIFVIVCAIIVHFAEDKEHTAKFIDPILSIFSCVLVVALSYPYMKEACLILLQAIPGNIDMDNFESTLVKKFPEIVSYHDLHIWQLSPHKYIATVHIIFQNPKLFAKTIDDVRMHFHDHSIAHVTIQPEFHNEKTNSSSVECLTQCTRPECLDKVCCKDSITDLREVSVSPEGKNEHDKCGKNKKETDHHGHGHSHKHGNHSHKHNNNHKNQVQAVPKENHQIHKAEANNIDEIQPESVKDETATSHMPAVLNTNSNKTTEDLKESSIKTKSEEKTETDHLSQTEVSKKLTTSQDLSDQVDEPESTNNSTKC